MTAGLFLLLAVSMACVPVAAALICAIHRADREDLT